MCICPSEFYKLLKVFNVTTGGGNANLSYGEMLITNNARPTYETFPSSSWFKVEAGNPDAPTTPPDYSLYGPGDLYNWEFDAVNARLIYVGAPSGYYSVRLSMSVCMSDGSGSFISFALRKNDDITVDNVLFEKSIMPMTARVGLSMGNVISAADSVSLQATDFFETNDYIDFVVQNNSDSDLPIVSTMNYFVSSLGDESSPITDVNLITESGINVITDTGDNIIVNS